MNAAVVAAAVLWLARSGAGGAGTANTGAGGAGAAPPVASACFPTEAAPGLGIVDPFHAPAPQALALNAEGKVLYRQGRWDEARAKYRAAEVADPAFLAPALNVACSFVRQDRLADALAEAGRLLDRAFVPWNAEIASAADLGALKVGATGQRLRAAIDARRAVWATGLGDDVIVLGRLRAPLGLGDRAQAAGVLVLGPRQELLAWSPRTRRYRQLTAEEGRVLAFARSADGHRVAFVTAEKLVRTPGAEPALRGVTIAEIDLGTLAPLGRSAVAGDVRRLEIVAARSTFTYRIDAGTGAGTWALADVHLDPMPAARAGEPPVTLTGHGVADRPPAVALRAGCAGTARDRVAASGTVAVVVRGRGVSSEVVIGGPFGASLAGLPIP